MISVTNYTVIISMITQWFGLEFLPDSCYDNLSLPYTFSLKTVDFSIKLGMGMKCSSRHTIALIVSTFCTPRIYILASGGPREALDRSQPTKGRPNSLLYIGLCTFQLG